MWSYKVWNIVILILFILLMLLAISSVANLIIKGTLSTIFTGLTIQIINVVFLITIVLIIHILVMENSNPVHTLAWILVLVFVPVLGFVFYLFFGRNWRKNRIFNRKGQRDAGEIRNLLPQSSYRPPRHSVAARLIALMDRNPKAILTTYNQVELIADTRNAFDRICEGIRQAKSHIHLEYFSIANDSTGRTLMQLLLEKRKQGVEIRLIYDDVGSWKLGRKAKLKLRDAGVELAPFMPAWIPFLNSKLNYRNHRKLVIIDGLSAYLGGLNIGDQYLGLDKYFGYWRDSLMVINGEGSLALQSIFLMDWFFVSRKDLLIDQHWDRYLPMEQAKQGIEHPVAVQVLASGPDTDHANILQVYFDAISSAAVFIGITTPYLILNESLLMALKTAAGRGVRVQIVVPGKADHLMVYWASRSYFEELLLAGVEIFIYQKGFMHAKVLIIDNEVLSVGTTNMDLRSFNHNFELNAMIFDESLAVEALAHFTEDLSHSIKLEYEEFRRRSTYKRSLESLFRLFSPLL